MVQRINLEEYTDWVAPTPPDEKYCHRCQLTKPSKDFHKNKVRGDGLSVYCRSCANETVTVSKAVDRLFRGKPLTPGQEVFRKEAERLLEERKNKYPKHGSYKRYRKGPDENGNITRGCRCPKCTQGEKRQRKIEWKRNKEEREAPPNYLYGKAPRS